MGRSAKTKEQKNLQNRKPNPSPLDQMVTDEPVSIVELQSPPEYLNEYALAEWNFITPELAKLGILAKIDKAAIAACCQAYGRFVQAQIYLTEHGDTTISEKGYELPSPYVAIANKSIEIWHKFLKEFGLTPASRRKLGTEKPPSENEYEKWQKRKARRKKKS